MARPTREKIVAELTELGVEFTSDAPYGELLEKYMASKSSGEERLTPSVPAAPEVEEEVEEERLKPSNPEQGSASAQGEDYLRKYQYRKQTVYGSKESDPPAGSKAENMKKFLLAQPRVRIFVPRTSGEDKTVLQTVCLNGYRLDFPKNTYLELPLQIAEVLGESLAQTEQAIERMRIDGDKAKEAALS